jgi:4-amino-4-deoxy-L-arabinose transferase-like glycosyltransferase
MGYPFELEWMEGGMVDHVRRVLSGLPVYAKPSIEFVSFLYPPLYYEAAAIAARVCGLGFTPLRLVSLLSSLGAFVMLFRIVHRETGAAFPGVVAAGLFAATYDRVGGWFDLARLDSFYLLLLLAGVYTLRFAATAAGAIVAGLLMGAAFLTKQSALVIAVPLLVGAALAHGRRAAWFAGASGLVIGGGTVLLDRLTGGWFHYYCFYLPARHPRLDGGWSSFWTTDLLPALPIGMLLAAYYAATRARPGGGHARYFLPLAALGMIGSSWSVRTMFGAELNNLLPAFAAVACSRPSGFTS